MQAIVATPASVRMGNFLLLTFLNRNNCTSDHGFYSHPRTKSELCIVHKGASGASVDPHEFWHSADGSISFQGPGGQLPWWLAAKPAKNAKAKGGRRTSLKRFDPYSPPPSHEDGSLNFLRLNFVTVKLLCLNHEGPSMPRVLHPERLENSWPLPRAEPVEQTRLHSVQRTNRGNCLSPSNHPLSPLYW